MLFYFLLITITIIIIFIYLIPIDCNRSPLLSFSFTSAPPVPHFLSSRSLLPFSFTKHPFVPLYPHQLCSPSTSQTTLPSLTSRPHQLYNRSPLLPFLSQGNKIRAPPHQSKLFFLSTVSFFSHLKIFSCYSLGFVFLPVL